MFPGVNQVDPIIDLVDQRMDFPMLVFSPSSRANHRLPGILDAGAGSFAKRTCPHFRHLLARSSLLGSTTQHGAFPLRPAFWVRPASSFRMTIRDLCSDLVQEYHAPIRLLAPHRPEFRSRLYPHLPSDGFRLGFALPVGSPFRLRVSHYSSHTFSV